VTYTRDFMLTARLATLVGH